MDERFAEGLVIRCNTHALLLQIRRSTKLLHQDATKQAMWQFQAAPPPHALAACGRDCPVLPPKHALVALGVFEAIAHDCKSQKAYLAIH